MSGLYENLPFPRGDTYYSALGGAVVPQIDDITAYQYIGKEYLHMDQAYGTGMYVKVRVCRNDSGGYLMGKRLVRFGNYSGTYGSYYPAGSNTITVGGSTSSPATFPQGMGYSSVLGYAAFGSTSTTGAEKTAIVDDLLPANFMIQPYDLFYVVVSGPCLALASITAADYANGQAASGITIGDFLCAATGATTGATTAATTNAATIGLVSGSTYGFTYANTSGRFASAFFGITGSATVALTGPSQGITALNVGAMFNQFSNVCGRAISSVSTGFVTAASTSAASAGTGTLGATYQPLLIQAGFGLWE